MDLRSSELSRNADEAAASLDAPQAARIERFAEVIASGDPALVFNDLPQSEIFNPDRIPGRPAMAARDGDYTVEYRTLIVTNERASAPYVDHPTGVRLDQWATLNNSTAWSAAQPRRSSKLDN